MYYRLLLINCLFCLFSCAPTTIYHSPHAVCEASKKGRQPACSKEYIEYHSDYTLGFVEIDDKGWFQDRKQMESFISELNRDKNSEVLLLVYAHGWKHNADNNDRDLNRLRRTLSHLADVERQSQNPREVIGLYIGWRGLSVKIPGIKEFSFWERKSTAHNAGETANEVFTKLQLIIDHKRMSENNSSSYVIVGHSFGGALVYSAMRPIIISRLSKQKYAQTLNPNEEGIHDLVVLLNPAFEAARVRELRESFNDMQASPYLVVLTADNDNATKLAFPAGRHLSTLFDKYTKEDNQKQADHKAIGHFKPFFTHVLKDNEDVVGSGCGKRNIRSIAKAYLQDDYSNVEQWLADYHKVNHRLLLDDSSIEQTSKTINPDNPIQIIQVKDRDILDKHSNIVCDDLVDLLRTYIIFNSKYNSSKE